MKKFLSCVLAILMMVSIAADAKSRSYRSSVKSKPSYTTNRSTPAAKPARSYEAPKAAAPSNTSLRGLGFSKPASQPAVKPQTASVSPKPAEKSWFQSKPKPQVTTYTDRKPKVVTSQVRKVSSPTAYRSSQVKRTTNVQRNYYGSNYGYNRNGGGYYSNNYRSYGGYGGSSMADSFIGTMGGMMMYNALFSSNHGSSGGGATAAQIEQAKANQRIEDKLDQVIAEQDKPDYNYVESPKPQAVLPVAQAPCYLPEDAPLMMDPKFYCGK